MSMVDHVSYATVVADLEAHPDKRLFWQSGFSFRGAREGEISRNPADYPKRRLGVQGCPPPPVINSWRDELRKKYDWACVVDCKSNSDDEIHLVGYSVNDMW